MKAKGRFGTLRPFHMISVSAYIVASFAFAAPASAQLEGATGIADPSKAGERLSQPDMLPRVEPAIAVKDVRPAGAPAGSENIKFTLSGIRLDGASVYSDAAVRSVYADKIGKTVSLADVYGIAADLTRKYRNDGYILTQVVVPPQEISGGVPTLRVVEGYISNITLQKEDANAPVNMALVEAYAAKISKGSALNARDLERQLLLINDLPGVTARTVLSPSQNTPGAADMLIVVGHDPFDGIVSADNYGSRYLGPIQLSAAGTLNSLLGQNEAITMQAVVAPQSWYELAYGSLGYEQPIGVYGTKAHINASVTDTDPGYDLKQFDVEGRSYLVNVGVTHPFIRSRTENLTGRLNFDWRRVKSSNDIEETRRDRLSVLRAGGRYEFIDTIFGAAANTADLELSKGLNIFGANEEGDDNMSRDGGDPQFTKLEAELQRLQRVTNSVNLLLAGRGQIASDALLSSEEFSVGGFNGFGRSYDPSEINGEHGIAGRVELQWNDPVKADPAYINGYQLYGFYDIGRVWNEDATTNSQKRDSLAAAGAGVRLELPYEINAAFAVAVPLTRTPQTEDSHDPKLYFSVSKRF